MSKILIILAVIAAAAAGIYWFFIMQPADSSAPAQEEAEENVNQIAFIPKGPLGIASNADGEYLVDKNGRTLYADLRSQSQAGKVTSGCDAQCELTWLPYLAGEGEGGLEQSADPLLSKLNLFQRADGKMQYALGTTLLYRNVNDLKAGDINKNLGDAWLVARP